MLNYFRLSLRLVFIFTFLAIISIIVTQITANESNIQYHIGNYTIYTTTNFLVFFPTVFLFIFFRLFLLASNSISSTFSSLLRINIKNPTEITINTKRNKNISILEEIQTLKRLKRFDEALKIASTNYMDNKKVLFEYLIILLKLKKKRSFLKEFKRNSCFHASRLFELTQLKSLNYYKRLKILYPLYKYNTKNATINYLYSKCLHKTSNNIEAQNVLENFLDLNIEIIDEPDCTKAMKDLLQVVKGKNFNFISRS